MNKIARLVTIIMVMAANAAFGLEMPYVSGDKIIDGSGKLLLLRGAQIESPFNVIKQWEKGKAIEEVLNPSVFQAMAQQWKMNVVRIPIANWIYSKYPKEYLGKLDQVVNDANKAGLYVVIDLHDDGRSGSPYGKEATLPKKEDLEFWKFMAGHYKNNPMIMFDLYNEPKVVGWQAWLHGGETVGSATTVGFQDMVDAIRAVGAKQIIIVEPGKAGDSPKEKGWTSVGTNTINDPNIVYSLHVYGGINESPQQLDAKWGAVLHRHPIYYGEWALLPNAYWPAHCRNVDPAHADQVVQNFLDYMTSRGASWTAWDFHPYRLIENYTDFKPTTLDIPWTCGDRESHAGMGTIVKHYLTGN